MATDIETFFDIYVRPARGTRLDRNGFAARYAAAALLVACGKADDDADPEEDRVIRGILGTTFDLSQRTIDQIMRLADENTGEGALATIASLVNEHYREGEKRGLLEHVWRVAFADGRVDEYEEKFVDRVAELLRLTPIDVAETREIVRPD